MYWNVDQICGILQGRFNYYCNSYLVRLSLVYRIMQIVVDKTL